MIGDDVGNAVDVVDLFDRFGVVLVVAADRVDFLEIFRTDTIAMSKENEKEMNNEDQSSNL